MIDEVRGLLDQYAQWVRDKSILREVNDQYVEITTPYLDRHNDYTQIYVRKDDGGFVLTDGGDTTLHTHPSATTTSKGMVGEPPLDVALDRLPMSALVADIVYIPRETPLLAAARQRGNPTVNGLGMLLHQARPAFRAWFGIMPEVTPELRALIEATT